MQKDKRTSLFDGSIFGYTWKSRGIVFLTNITCVTVFILFGYFLSNWLGKSSKHFIVGGVLISFPVAQFIIYKLLIKNKDE